MAAEPLVLVLRFGGAAQAIERWSTPGRKPNFSYTRRRFIVLLFSCIGISTGRRGGTHAAGETWHGDGAASSGKVGGGGVRAHGGAAPLRQADQVGTDGGLGRTHFEGNNLLLLIGCAPPRRFPPDSPDPRSRKRTIELRTLSCGPSGTQSLTFFFGLVSC